MILEDYKVRWGDPMMYQQDVLRGHARRMKGIPTYAYWASLLDPRTKVKAAKLLTARERCMIWKDIQDAICSITETHTTLPNNGNQTDGPDKENKDLKNIVRVEKMNE